MPKYADITPFYEWLDWLAKESNSRFPEYNTMMFYEIQDKLDDLPELVRCRDCKYCDYAFDKYWCEYHWNKYNLSPSSYEVKADGFCNNAERKDNG